MGSTNISNIGYGYNARATFQALCAEADAEYGRREGYSGAINSAAGYREIKLDAKFIDPNGLVPLRADGRGIAPEFLNKLRAYERTILDKTDKFSGVACVNLGIVHYVKWNIKPKTHSKRLFDKYTLYTLLGQYVDSSVDLSKLEQKAISYIKSTGDDVYIAGTLKNGQRITVKTFDVRQVQSRRKPKDMTGCTPLYAYWFCGWVSC